MNHALIICLLGLASFGLISGHFTMDYPPTRGFMEDDEDKFCGGFPTNATGRHPFPISGPAHVALMAHHGSPKISISISFKHNFTSEAEFNGTELISNAPLPHPGNACFEIDLSNVTSKMTPKPSNGTLATLEVKYDAGGEALYQCSDLVLVQDAAVTNQSLSSCSAVMAEAALMPSKMLKIALLTLCGSNLLRL
ncbi:hypothetical protein BY996DRAFT_6426298 [Phakopsora pachyrhizi]|nr:hypothetical protein BY996DRAFT_6426298 [Phakopsora pachyrhizi]